MLRTWDVAHEPKASEGISGRRSPSSPTRAQVGFGGYAAARKTATNLTPPRMRQAGSDVIKPSSSRAGSVDRPEALARQAEWEQQVQSLDQKEMELHQSQMKLLREQLKTFTHELIEVKQAVLELQEHREKDSVQLGMVQEQAHREHRDGHEEALALISTLHQTVADHKEEHKGGIESLKGSHHAVMGDFQTALRHLQQEHAKLHDRCGGSEAVLAEAKDKHLALEDKLSVLRDAHHDYVGHFTKHYDDFETLKGSHAQHASLPQRLAYLEELIGDSAEQLQQPAWGQAQRLQGRSPLASRTSMGPTGSLSSFSGRNFGKEQAEGASANDATLKGRLVEVERALGLQAENHGNFKQRQAEMESHHSTFGERVDYIEKMLGDSADKHEAELNQLKIAHEKNTQDFESHHATVGERVDYLEKALGDSADDHAAELQHLRDAHSQHAQDLHGLKHLHASHATVEERLSFMEGLLGDSADTHGDAHVGRSRLDSLAGTCPILERLDCIESTVGDTHAKHFKAMESLKNSHDRHADLTTRHARDLEGLNNGHAALNDSHAALAGDLEALTNGHAALNRSHSAHARDLEALGNGHAALNNSHTAHARDFEALANGHAALNNSHAAHAGQHTTLAERVNYLENQLGDSAEKHAAAVTDLHQRLSAEQALREDGAAHHATVNERVVFLEKVIGVKCADGHDQETHTMALNARMDFLEGVIGNRADGQVDGHVPSFRRGGPKSSVSFQGSSMEDRLQALERGVTEEFRMTNAKVESCQNRMMLLRQAWCVDSPTATPRGVRP